MDYISQRLTQLRQEIALLQSTNASFSRRELHTEDELAGCELRANRLSQIKKELSGMMGQRHEELVWWERRRGGLQP